MTLKKAYPIASFKAREDLGPGKFEAVVSVFGNVDLQGDRVMPGAFAKNLAVWRRKGDPIPVIWSHDWLNPDAHIGYVDPKDATEITDGLGGPGGLLVKGHMDVHKPFAGQVYDLLKEKRVKEWSFAYDVDEESVNEKDGANELKALSIIEVGPCLKGANPDTYTRSAKTALESELQEAYEAQRSLTKFIELIKTIDDPTIAKVLTKSFMNPAEARTKRYHVELVTDGYACIDNETDEPVDFHKTDEEAATHIRTLQKILIQKTPTMSEDEIRAALDLGPAPTPPTEIDISDLEAAVAQVEEKTSEPTLVAVTVDGYKFQVDPDALILDEEVENADGEKRVAGTITDESFLEGPVVEAGDKAGTKPWHVEERGDQFCVIKDDTGAEVSCHDTREDADAHVRALYANESSESAEGEKTNVPGRARDLRAHLVEAHGRSADEVDELGLSTLQHEHREDHAGPDENNHHVGQLSATSSDSKELELAATNFNTVTTTSTNGNFPISYTGTTSLDDLIKMAVEKAVAEALNGHKTVEGELIKTTEPEGKSELAEYNSKLSKLLGEEK